MMSFILIILTCFWIANAIYLDVHVGIERCLGQELDQEDQVSFKIGVDSIDNTNSKESHRSIEVKVIIELIYLSVPS